MFYRIYLIAYRCSEMLDAIHVIFQNRLGRHAAHSKLVKHVQFVETLLTNVLRQSIFLGYLQNKMFML